MQKAGEIPRLSVSKTPCFFVKLHFTKNLAVLVKKSDKSDVFDGC